MRSQNCNTNNFKYPRFVKKTREPLVPLLHNANHQKDWIGEEACLRLLFGQNTSNSNKHFFWCCASEAFFLLPPLLCWYHVGRQIERWLKWKMTVSILLFCINWWSIVIMHRRQAWNVYQGNQLQKCATRTRQCMKYNGSLWLCLIITLCSSAANVLPQLLTKCHISRWHAFQSNKSESGW